MVLGGWPVRARQGRGRRVGADLAYDRGRELSGRPRESLNDHAHAILRATAAGLNGVCCDAQYEMKHNTWMF